MTTVGAVKSDLGRFPKSIKQIQLETWQKLKFSKCVNFGMVG
jgi:hypothetical protein